MHSLPATVIGWCLALGVHEFVVCAGSRNSPLVLQLASAAPVHGLRLWRFFEERCAAFFALGRVRQTGRPVAVLTTSGTAAAELFPAVIEAHYQGIPLIAVTADRPRRFRGSGAPQAIEQERLYGDYAEFLDVEFSADLLAASRSRSGPFHLNVCLEEPEKGGATAEEIPQLSTASNPTPAPDPAAVVRFIGNASELLVMLGDLLEEEQETGRQVLQALPGVPVWAESASGLRSFVPRCANNAGLWFVRGGDATLRRLPVRKVLRLGGVPSCRFWRDLETHPEIAVLSLTRSSHSGLARQSQVLPLGAFTEPLRLPNCNRLDEFFRRDLALAPQAIAQTLPESECGLLRRLSFAIPPQSGVFLGNSLAVRQWNLIAETVSGAHCHAMRGANGIDGNISYFFGLFADFAESWAIIGDLTALYDLAAPWILTQLPMRNRRIVVINNGGGKIFNRLPSLRGVTGAARDFIENPHEIRLDGWAKMWGMHYVRLEAGVPWPEQFPDGNVVIEVLPDAAQSESFWSALAAKEAEVWRE